MRLDKLTIKSQEALAEAQSQAAARGHGEIQPAHLLGALLGQPEGSTVPVLQKLGVSVDALRGELKAVSSLLVAGDHESSSERLGSLIARLADHETSEEQLFDDAVGRRD